VLLEGPVRLTMFPWLGLRAGPVTVRNAPGFGPEPLAQVQSVTIGLNLWALTRKQILVESVTLGNPTLQLSRDAQGRENWLATIAPPPGEDPSPGWKVDSLPYGLRLANASLAYTDALTGARFSVSRLNLHTGSGKTFDFSLSCQVTASHLGATAEIHAKGRASYGPTGEHIFVHGAEVTGVLGRTPVQAFTEASAQAVQADPKAQFSATVLFHGQGGAVDISHLVVEGLGARVTGQVDIAGLYEDTPTLRGSLTASAERNGPWMGLLRLDAPQGPALAPPPNRETLVPSLRAPAPPRRIEAELDFGAAPGGWKVDKFVLRDGPGKLTAEASWLNQDLRFEARASELDLDAWIPHGGAEVALPPGWPRPGWSVHGKVSARDVRLAGQDVGDLRLSAQGEHGALRLYPFTVRAAECVTSADLRLQPTPEGATFTAQASAALMPRSDTAQLPPASAAASTPGNTAEARLSGEITPAGATGALQLRLDDLPATWQPSQIPEAWAKTLRALGGLSAKCAFRAYAPQGRPDEAWNAWEATGLEVNTRQGLLSGSLSGKDGKVVVDLAADRLELDRLAALTSLGGGAPAVLFPWPLEGRVNVRRFAAWGQEFEDVVATGQVSAQAVKLSTVSAVLGGGKLSGGFSLEDKAGRRQASLTLAGSGLQGAPLSALLPSGPRLTGLLEGRVSLEASEGIGQPLWRNARAQADLQMGPGSVGFGPATAKPGAPWPVNRAVLALKIVSRAPSAQGPEPPREAALADVTGSLRLETPGSIRQSQMELHGQAGLDASGRPLWYRQPQAEGSLSFIVPFAQPVRMASCQWKGKFETDLEKGSFSLSDVALNAAGLPARLRVSGNPGPGGVMTLAGMLDIPEFSPRDAANRLGLTVPPLAGPQTWRRARLSAELAGTPKDVRINRIAATLDDALLTGQAALTAGKTRLDLAVNVLDLDSLSPGEDIVEPAKRPEQAIPLDMLREGAVEVRLQAGKLIKSRLVWGNALLEANILGGRFSYRQQAEDFYRGKFLLDVQGDARGPELKTQATMRVSGTSGVELLKDLSGGSALTKGVLEFELNAASSGNTDKVLIRRLAGTARFDLMNGAMVFRDSNAKPHQAAAPTSQILANDRDTVAPKPAPTAAADATPFGRMGAAFVIRQGVGATKEFMLTGPAVSAKGPGTVSLVDETIALNLLASVKDVGELPVRIYGPLYDPKLDIDRSGILAETIVNIVKGVVNTPANLLHHLRRLF